MRVLFAYMSKTGNTKKVAEAIYGALDCEKQIMPIDQVVDISRYELSSLGFPIQRFGPDPKAVRFLQKHCQPGRDVALSSLTLRLRMRSNSPDGWRGSGMPRPTPT